MIKVFIFLCSKIKGYKNENYYCDLLQEGNLALIKAIESFDPEKGLNFFTIASWYISNSIKQYLKKNVNNKEYLCEDALYYKKNDIKNQLDLLEAKEIQDILKDILYSLPRFERIIVMMRYGLLNNKVYTLQQLGEKFSVSKQYIEKMERKVLLKLYRIFYIIEDGK